MKKYIKLINHERLSKKITAEKACDISSYDLCNIANYDNGNCTTTSYDKCGKDFEGCSQNSEDLCTAIDYKPCSNGSDDTCSIDYSMCSSYDHT